MSEYFDVDRKDLLTLYDNCLALTYLSVSGPENLPPLRLLQEESQFYILIL